MYNLENIYKTDDFFLKVPPRLVYGGLLNNLFMSVCPDGKIWIYMERDGEAGEKTGNVIGLT